MSPNSSALSQHGRLCVAAIHGENCRARSGRK